MSNEFLKNLRNLSAFRVNAFPGETHFSDRFGRIRASRSCPQSCHAIREIHLLLTAEKSSCELDSAMPWLDASVSS